MFAVESEIDALSQHIAALGAPRPFGKQHFLGQLLFILRIIRAIRHQIAVNLPQRIGIAFRHINGAQRLNLCFDIANIFKRRISAEIIFLIAFENNGHHARAAQFVIYAVKSLIEVGTGLEKHIEQIAFRFGVQHQSGQ